MTGSAKRPLTTFSIAAVDLATGDVGVAVASRFLAAGAVVPWASADAGAVATQSYADASAGPRGLAMMRDGLSADEALTRLVGGRESPARWQVALVDARGGAAAYTGAECPDWAGHVTGGGFSCQGNLLAGKPTVVAMAVAFESATGALADRLCRALRAGEAAGGDRRGRQSAALYVARARGGYLGFNDVLVDLRVDDAPDPVGELERLLKLHGLYFGSSRPDEKLAIEGALLAEIKAMMIRAGHLDGDPASAWDDATRRSLDLFVGMENLEERFDLDARTVDPPALAHLRTLYGAKE